MRVIRHDVVDSTSERAFAEITAGRAQDGDVHVARAQTSGRGRHGRPWHSAPGEGLYASVVLMPGPPPWNAAAVTMALGLAALDAVRELGLAHATMKWPNDVVVEDAKVAGVLVETRGLDPRSPAYVAGIGVNVLQREFPPELVAEREVTSLALQGVDADVERTLQVVLDALPRRIESIRADQRALADEFAIATGLLGWLVRVETAEGIVEGDLLEISIERGLIVRSAESEERDIPLELVRQITLG